jgi:alpha-L-fucosidase 2
MGYIMKYKIFSFAVCATLSLSVWSASPSSGELTLWYLQPADEWMKALPLGNGRLGAMVYGGTQVETLALNEITMWSGAEDPYQENFCGKAILSEIRKEFFAGRIDKGNDLSTHFLAGTPHSFGSHLPIGDLKLSFDTDSIPITDYRRSLDLRKAVADVTFQSGNTVYRREYLCSNPDKVLVVRCTANRRRSLSATLSLVLTRKATISTQNNELIFSGNMMQETQKMGVSFTGKVKVVAKGGTVHNDEQTLRIVRADELLIYIDVRTDYKQPDYQELCETTIKKAAARPYDALLSDHIADYSRLFSRVELSLGKGSDTLPTDVRWAEVKTGKDDPSLDALFFQYGRYLLLSSSREDSPLPANLQGVWNDNLACNMGWNCDYHLDINTEQNYWPANLTNLPECNAPLFRYIADLAVHGARTAQKVYGSPGWVAHTIANVWGYTPSGGGVNWGLFPTASCWIASHLWEHYRYTQDLQFLRETAYPLLKENARFFLDYMTEDPRTGYLVTGPCTSPENTFLFNGGHYSLSLMPTCDKVLVTEIYNACIRSSEILGVDTDFRQALQAALLRFPPFRIGKNGGVQEWLDDYDEASPNHRHTSHLLALYPYGQISLEKTPALAAAARQTLRLRENAPGWEDVEWSRANLICNYARLKDSGEAYRSVKMLEKDFTRENLLSISPKGIAGAPWDIFVLDGNTAATAGIAEMLLQTHEGYIDLLPVLPEAWSNGSVRGLCIPGGVTVDMRWKDGQVKEVILQATADYEGSLKTPAGDRRTLSLRKGDNLKLYY